VSPIATTTLRGQQRLSLDTRPQSKLRPGGPEGTAPRRRGNSGACSDGGSSLTLDERISRVWEGLTAVGAHGAAECPVCEAPALELRGAAATCRGCGSRLS
jgi:hypothetical protein